MNSLHTAWPQLIIGRSEERSNWLVIRDGHFFGRRERLVRPFLLDCRSVVCPPTLLLVQNSFLSGFVLDCLSG